MPLHTTICSLFYLVKPMRAHHWLVLWSLDHIPNIVSNYGVILLHHRINTNRLLHCFLKGRWLCHNTCTHKCHLLSVPLWWPPLSALRRVSSHIIPCIIQQSVSLSGVLSSLSWIHSLLDILSGGWINISFQLLLLLVRSLIFRRKKWTIEVNHFIKTQYG